MAAFQSVGLTARFIYSFSCLTPVKYKQMSNRTFTLDEAQMLLPILESLLKQAINGKKLIDDVDAELQETAHRVFLNGGTMLIDSPHPYSAVADGLLKKLGIDPVALSQKCTHRDFYPSLGLRRGVVLTLLAAGAAGLIISLAGGPVPH